MRRALTAFVASALLVTGSVAGRAADAPCTDDSRQCVIDTALTYLHALVTHDIDSVRLAPDVWRMNNGHVAAQGEPEVRQAIGSEPVASWSTLRWVVDGNDAVAYYDLDTDFTRTVQSQTYAPPQTYVPAYIAERFHVVAGLIEEIEVVYWGDPTFAPRPDRPLRGTSFSPGPCADGSRACQISTASTYLNAFLTHDASNAALAADAWRIENGGNTGDSGQAIRDGVESPVMHVIVDLQDIRWFVEGDQAVAYYTLYADGTGAIGPPSTPPELLTPAFIVERFRIQDGLIKEIEAVFWIDPPGSKPDPRPA
jgi:hypothetical protein